MIRIIFTILVSILFASSACALTQMKPIKHVIYITWDGVRWQDVFLDHNRLPIFWSKYAKKATIYGLPNGNTTMEVASIPVSLPSYQSQMAGSVQPGSCSDNECGRIKTETFPEYFVNKLHFKKKDVATISSWEVTDYAVESVEGTTFTNDGTRPMYDPDTHVADNVMAEINQQQAADYPGDDTRLDKYTFAQAMHYFEKYQPAYLWISFGDADDYAHDGNLTAYQQTISFYDDTIDKIMTLLSRLKLDEETMIIITTDHGRGNGDKWTDHGEAFPESKQTWAFVFNGKLTGGIKDGKLTRYSTLSIRPTIEKIFAYN